MNLRSVLSRPYSPSFAPTISHSASRPLRSTVCSDSASLIKAYMQGVGVPPEVQTQIVDVVKEAQEREKNTTRLLCSAQELQKEHVASLAKAQELQKEAQELQKELQKDYIARVARAEELQKENTDLTLSLLDVRREKMIITGKLHSRGLIGKEVCGRCIDWCTFRQTVPPCT